MTNVPSVTVSNVPEVQVGNDPSSPIPVVLPSTPLVAGSPVLTKHMQVFFPNGRVPANGIFSVRIPVFNTALLNVQTIDDIGLSLGGEGSSQVIEHGETAPRDFPGGFALHWPRMNT